MIETKACTAAENGDEFGNNTNIFSKFVEQDQIQSAIDCTQLYLGKSPTSLPVISFAFYSLQVTKLIFTKQKKRKAIISGSSVFAYVPVGDTDRVKES